MIFFCKSIQGYLFLLVLFLLFSPVSAGSYILPGPHVIDLVTETIKEPSGLVVHQEISVMDKGESESVGTVIPEKVWISYPGRYRSERNTTEQRSIFAVVDREAVKIVNEVIITNQDTPTDRYMDIWLYRDRIGLSQRLKLSGVNLDVVSLQRFNGSICYVLGDIKNRENRSSSFWVDKETFFPVRYVIQKDSWFVEIFYRDWKKVSRTWYPENTQIFLDQVPIYTVVVKNIELESVFPDSFFNISRLKRMYPEAYSIERTEEPGQTDQIQESIQNFNRLYE